MHLEILPGIEAPDLERRRVQSRERVDQVGAVFGPDVLDREGPIVLPVRGPALVVAGDVLVVVRLLYVACEGRLIS